MLLSGYFRVLGSVALQHKRMTLENWSDVRTAEVIHCSGCTWSGQGSATRECV